MYFEQSIQNRDANDFIVGNNTYIGTVEMKSIS